MSWIRRVRDSFHKQKLEDQLDDELQFHIEMRIREFVTAGMSPEEARRQATRLFGNQALLKEITRDMDTIGWIEALLKDLNYGLRTLRKSPGFAAVAVLVTALGIGANTAVFSVVNTVLLKPLAFREPDRIVTLSTLWKKSSAEFASAPDYHDWHDRSTAFSAMAYYSDGDASLAAGRVAEYVHVAAVTQEFLRVFEVAPARGRFFNAEEWKPGGAGALVVSASFWKSHFGGSVLGQTVRMFDRNLTIVGVLPSGFHFPNKTEVWLPANTIFRETTSRGAHNYLVVGRLRPEVSLEQAQAQMTAIGARLGAQYPDSNGDNSVAVARLRDRMVRDVRLTLYLLLGTVSLVLLIACANVANMLLAKATVRTREIAIRAAVGASRGRIVRQLVTESVLMALAAGAVGLVLAAWGADALAALAPSDVPRLAETHIDTGVLAFTFGISLLASLLFGLAPALQLSQTDLNEALKQSASRAVTGGGAGRMRSALVVGEIALAVILLAGAGLLMKSFAALHDVALGFRSEKLLVMQTSVPASDDIESVRRAARFYKTLSAQIAALPGVSAVGAARSAPPHVMTSGGYFIDRLPRPGQLSSGQAVYSVVTPGTFAALGIPIERGRDFNEADLYEAPFTAIINEALARKAFPDQDPVGRVVYCGLDSEKPMKIVGIVGDVRQFGPAITPWPEIYMPNEQHPQTATALNVLVRTTIEPGALIETLRRKVRALSPDVPVKFTTMEASLGENTAAPRFRALLLSIFAGLAVILAVAGVYGVMAYVVGQRSNEIGLRMALGANSGDVLRLVLRQGLTLAGLGLALGLVGALGATRLLTSMLFEVKPSDTATYVGAAVLLGIVALTASAVPAWRATKVDPLIALRQE
jgi:putative ABC transport system permease protein